jgi:ABC-type hemin transport system ATPase subunit
LSIREYKLSAGGTEHLAPGSLRGVRGPDGTGEGTIYEVQTGQSFAEVSYTAGEAPYLNGPITSVAGAVVATDL